VGPVNCQAGEQQGHYYVELGDHSVTKVMGVAGEEEEAEEEKRRSRRGRRRRKERARAVWSEGGSWGQGPVGRGVEGMKELDIHGCRKGGNGGGGRGGESRFLDGKGVAGDPLAGVNEV